MNSNFEGNGGTYLEQGDYFIPNLTVKNVKEHSVGIWGQRRKRYLKEQHRVLYYNMLTSETLYEHLVDIDEQAEELFSRLVKQLAEKEKVTEKFKADDALTWVQRMNNIRERAMKIVNTELIFV